MPACDGFVVVNGNTRRVAGRAPSPSRGEGTLEPMARGNTPEVA
jgi:hypothetical protein